MALSARSSKCLHIPTKPNSKIRFINYDITRCDSPRIVAGGVALIINSRISYHIFPQVIGCDILLIKIQSGLNLTVGVVYRVLKKSGNG